MGCFCEFLSFVRFILDKFVRYVRIVFKRETKLGEKVLYGRVNKLLL